MFTTYTDDIKAAARRHLHIWTTMLGLTASSNRSHVEQLVKGAYRAAGLGHPRRIVWCSSPLAMTWVRSITTEAWQAQVGQDVRAALIDAPLRRAWPPILRCMGRDFRYEILADLEGGLKHVARAREQALWGTLNDTCAAPFDNLPEGIRTAIGDALDAAGLVPLDLAPLTRLNYGSGGTVWGQLTPYAVTLSFLRRRMELVAETQGIAPLIGLLEETHAFIAHENVCWLSDKPTAITNESLDYADGWTVPISAELRAWARQLAERNTGSAAT